MRVVYETHSTLLVDRPGDYSQCRQRRLIEPQRKLADQKPCRDPAKTLAKAARQCRQYSVRFVFKNRFKTLRRYIDLAAPIKSNVLRRVFPVRRKITGCHCRGNTEAVYQVWASHIAQKP